MGITRTRLVVMMAVACCCFGCKGAGEMVRVVAVVAVTAARVVTTVAAAAVTSGEGSEPPPEAPVEAAEEAVPAQSVHPRCQELRPAPELPGDAVAVRNMVCGERWMVKDAVTGMWRDHR
jgi:hypothetical protein